MSTVRNTMFGVVGTISGIVFTIFLTQTVLAGIISEMDWFADNGLLGYFALVGVFIIMAILFVPGSLSKFICGHIFGFIPGMLFAWLASMIAALLPHAIAPKWLRPWASKMIANRPLMADVEQAITNDGWKTVAYTRISLVIPYAILNYAFAVTSV